MRDTWTAIRDFEQANQWFSKKEALRVNAMSCHQPTQKNLRAGNTVHDLAHTHIDQSALGSVIAVSPPPIDVLEGP